ncbi:MAG: TadE/TadG family type IV pilus assembly protein [Alphaproteobacteria bacterium]
MRRSIAKNLSFVRRFWSARSGATAVLAAVTVPMVVGFAGVAVDVGHVLQVQSALQSSTDAAALAGANNVYLSTAVATAQSYSSASGGKNAINGVTVTMPSGYPKLKCLSSTGVPCSGPGTANAIQVKQQATVPMWFAQIVGVPSMTVTATATAAAVGGQPIPLDVMIVLDTTASMNTSDPNCGIAGATRLGCALTGARTLLNELAPSGDYVGLMVFPGIANASQASLDYDCSSSTQPTIVSYRNSPVYQLLGLSNNFKTSNSATSLDTTSNLVKALKGGASGCTAGLSAVGGVGTYYSDAITAAKTALQTNGRANIQKVIIFLSDGDANASSSNMPTGKATNQCHQAITAAQAATTAGMWVYTIAYGASTSTTGSCGTDSPHISACSTLQQMATSSRYFYSDGTGHTGACNSSANPISNLVSIFQNIGVTLQAPRLVPDSTT